MPLAPSRLVTWPSRYAVYFDGIDDYVVITPFTVYGWSGITIQEWIYLFHPKANSSFSQFSMIGDTWTDFPSMRLVTDNRFDYTSLDARFDTRTSGGAKRVYSFSFYAYRNIWVNIARRFYLSDRVFAFFINAGKVGSATIPLDEKTILEWNPDTATYPIYYKRFVLGANTMLNEWMKLMQFQLLIYSRALSDSEIAWNYNNPFNPVRDGLRVCLIADPQYIKDIDGDGRLEWIDLSGYNNHGKIYGAKLVDLYKSPVRALSSVRTMLVAR